MDMENAKTGCRIAVFVWLSSFKKKRCAEELYFGGGVCFGGHM